MANQPTPLRTARVQRRDQRGKPISIAATIIATLKPARMYSPSISEETLALHAGSTSEYFLRWQLNDIGLINARQNDKGAEHVPEEPAPRHIFRVQHSLYARAIDMETVGIAVAAMVYMRLRDILPRDIFIAVSSQTGRGSGGSVKKTQFAHTVYFGQQKTNSADDHWQRPPGYAEEYQISMNDRATHQEEERQASFILPKTKFVASLAKSEQFQTSPEETFTARQRSGPGRNRASKYFDNKWR